MGIEVVQVPFKDLNAAWEAADKDQSKEDVQRWQKSAAKVEGVSPGNPGEIGGDVPGNEGPAQEARSQRDHR